MRLRTGRFLFWNSLLLFLLLAPPALRNMAGGWKDTGSGLPPATPLPELPGWFLQVKKTGTPAVLVPAYREKTAAGETGVKYRALLLPVTGARLTSPFGPRGERMHWGIDLAVPEGRPVRAAAAGEVLFAGWASGYGLLVVLEHKDFRTYYAHNSLITVEKNDKVAAGEIIAAVGRTGRATGSHLHFELEIQGQKVNPLPYLKTYTGGTTPPVEKRPGTDKGLESTKKE